MVLAAAITVCNEVLILSVSPSLAIAEVTSAKASPKEWINSAIICCWVGSSLFMVRLLLIGVDPAVIPHR